MDLEHPIMVGFNIATPEDFAFACQYARGGIIGSAFIKHISVGNDLAGDTTQFVKFILNN
jgi:tryptophan synthase alpha chain